MTRRAVPAQGSHLQGSHLFVPRGARARLSVGMFTYSTAPRGSVVHAAALSEALDRLGCDVTLYALNKGDEGFYRDVACRLALVPANPAVGTGQSLVRQRIDELASYLTVQGIKHDVFHAQDCLTANALLAVETHTAGRVFRTVHHIEPFECPYLSTCQERSILEADALCAVSRLTADEVGVRFDRRAWVVGNGVDSNRLQATPAERVVTEREQILAGRQGPLLLSVGGIEPRKNSLTTLRAFAELKLKYPDAVWVIVGGATALDHSGYATAFEAALSAYPWQRDVVRLGVIDETRMGATLGAADVLLNASIQEGFGLTVLEALAAGLPVVASTGAPFDEYLVPGSAFLADPLSAVSIADSAAMAIEIPIECQLVGRSVARGQGWDVVADRTLAAYEQHLGEAQQPRSLAMSTAYA